MRLYKYCYVYYRHVLESLFRSHVVGSCLILDAGCGSCGSSLSEVPSNVEFIGLDVSRDNLKAARLSEEHKIKTQNFNFVAASLMDLPFRTGTFDIVVCINVLEHIEAKEKALDELSNACRLNGHFVGSTSNLLNPLMLFDSYAPKRIVNMLVSRFAGEHYERCSRLTPATLAKTLRQAGFQFDHLVLLGQPPFKPLDPQERIPIGHKFLSYLWAAFNELTERKPFVMLKGVMVFEVTKKR